MKQVNWKCIKCEQLNERQVADYGEVDIPCHRCRFTQKVYWPPELSVAKIEN